MRTLEFPTFGGLWTPIAASGDLKRKPLGLTLDDVPVVLFRDAAGRAQALVDRCPHRSVKLSIGQVEGDTLRCSFHGWRFSGDGGCRHIPLNPDAKLSVVRAQPLACEECEGLLWLYAGEAASPPPLIMPFPMGEPGWFGSVTHRDWPVHWSRGVQTALDVAHVPFTHPNSIGTAFGRALGKTPDARLAHTMEPRSDGGFRMDWRIAAGPGAAAPDAGWVAFHPPNAMSLGIPQKKPGRVSLLVLWSVPLAAGASRTIVAARRNFGQTALVPRIYDLLTPVILGEDRRNIETAWPSEVPVRGDELSMPSDAPTVAFQRWYREYFRRAGEDEPVAA